MLDRETSPTFEDAQEEEVLIMPPVLRRADTFEELKNAVGSFSTALLCFLQAIVGLLPRLGTKAFFAFIYGLVACAVLYVFIVRGHAGSFVESVRSGGFWALNGGQAATVVAEL